MVIRKHKYALILLKSDKDLNIVSDYLNSKKIQFYTSILDAEFDTRFLILNLNSNINQSNNKEQILKRENRSEFNENNLFIQKFHQTEQSSKLLAI